MRVRVGSAAARPMRSLLPLGGVARRQWTPAVASAKKGICVRWYSTPIKGRSFSEGPLKPPLLHHTIPEHFATIVSQYGDRPAVLCRSPTTSADAFQSQGLPAPEPHETVFTYDSLDRVSNSLARSLRSLGVKKGDRVAVSLGNCPEFAALTYALFKLGAVLVPLNPGFNAKQVKAALTHLGVELLVVGAVTDLAYKPCRGRSNLPLLQSLVPDLLSGKVQSPDVPTLKNVVVVDNVSSHPLVDFDVSGFPSLTPFSLLSKAHAAPGPIVPDSPLSAADCINIQFTSGTTSHPKAAMLSHTAILNNGALIASRMALTPEDRVVCPPPLFHCFGSVLGYMATATTGASLLFPSPAFDPAAALRVAADHHGTALYGVATMFVAMLEQLDKVLTPEEAAGLPEHLRTGIVAGSSVPEALMRRLFGAMGLPDLVICYGMTETAPVSCMTTPSDPLDRRTGSVGRAMPHTAVKVVDPADRTRVLPVGERGELAAAGYLVMQGYWGDEARTKEVRISEPDDGGDGKERVWMYSGDEARMDDRGYVEITGRIKDLIIRGGENIHPLEVENALFQHPLVAEASVVGVPDERYGEAVGAFVIAHKGVRTLEDGEQEGEKGGDKKVLSKEDVREWVRTHLSSHLVPKHVFWVDEYPKTGSGKIQKFILRDEAKKILSGEKKA